MDLKELEEEMTVSRTVYLGLTPSGLFEPVQRTQKSTCSCPVDESCDFQFCPRCGAKMNVVHTDYRNTITGRVHQSSCMDPHELEKELSNTPLHGVKIDYTEHHGWILYIKKIDANYAGEKPIDPKEISDFIEKMKAVNLWDEIDFGLYNDFS